MKLLSYREFGKKADSDWLGEIWDWSKSIVVALAVVFFLHQYVFHLSTVRGSSMVPTLFEGEWLFINKWVYLWNEPRRGDIVIFREPGDNGESPQYLVKRIIGVPGDQLEIRGEKLYLNGKPVDEPYAVPFAGGDFGPIQVGEGRYFVMGDNRPVSRDSRSFDAIPIQSIEGRVDFVLWPPSKFGFLEAYSE